MILEGNMDYKKQSLFQWCFLNKINPLDIENNESFLFKDISLKEFCNYTTNGRYETDKLPTKAEEFLEYRMYGLVPYNISDTQKGIQFDHAKDNYSIEYGSDVRYNTFLKEWKTSIILDGGTSNEGHLVRHGFKTEKYYGSMQEHLQDLKNNDVKVSTFYEPDLNSMLSAIVFLVDERVFNKKLYPDYSSLPFNGETDEDLAEWSVTDIKRRNEWLTRVGGPTNEFLRKFLSNKKIA